MFARTTTPRLLQFLRNARFQFRRPINRRVQSTGAPRAELQQGAFRRIWDSPVGMKTVHFWAPVMKWALVIAGISDFQRPAEKLSLTQNIALTATGAIWTRWCFIIKPRNLLLAAVNFFLGCVGVVQVSRIVLYKRSLKNGTVENASESLSELASVEASKVNQTAEEAVEKVKKAVTRA